MEENRWATYQRESSTHFYKGRPVGRTYEFKGVTQHEFDTTMSPLPKLTRATKWMKFWNPIQQKWQFTLRKR